MNAIAADYINEYHALADNYGFSKEQMLVVLKAYQLLLKDNEGSKDESRNGWLGGTYMIAPKIFHKKVTINIDDLKEVSSSFWELSSDQKRVRLSNVGKAFVEENESLLFSVKEIIAGVCEL